MGITLVARSYFVDSATGNVLDRIIMQHISSRKATNLLWATTIFVLGNIGRITATPKATAFQAVVVSKKR